jgi:hypothetical protein
MKQPQPDNLRAYTIAPRRTGQKRNEPAELPDQDSDPAAVSGETTPSAVEPDRPQSPILAKGQTGRPALNQAKREPDSAKAASQEAVKRGTKDTHLQELRKRRDKSSKHFVNVAFPSGLKQRLDQASYENDVPSAEIVRVAVDKYLRENGYD